MNADVKMACAVLLGMLLFLICVMLGFVLGANIGGNHFTGFQAFGVQGYEATGILGAIIGFLAGAITACFMVIAITKNK